MQPVASCIYISKILSHQSTATKIVFQPTGGEAVAGAFAHNSCNIYDIIPPLFRNDINGRVC